MLVFSVSLAPANIASMFSEITLPSSSKRSSSPSVNALPLSSKTLVSPLEVPRMSSTVLVNPLRTSFEACPFTETLANALAAPSIPPVSLRNASLSFSSGMAFLRASPNLLSPSWVFAETASFSSSSIESWSTLRSLSSLLSIAAFSVAPESENTIPL